MRRAAFASTVLAASACWAVIPPLTPPQPPRWRVIHVVAGSYGQRCRDTHVDTTAHLQQICDGQPSCAYRVDVQAGGEHQGCERDFVAEWRCGDDAGIHRATAVPSADGSSIVELRCD